MGVVFDKLNFMKRQEEAGTFTRPQAEALSETFHQAISESVATKLDLAAVRHEVAELRTELKAEMSELRIEMTAGFGEIQSDMKAGLADMKVWSVSIAASIVAVLAAMKYCA